MIRHSKVVVQEKTKIRKNGKKAIQNSFLKTKMSSGNGKMSAVHFVCYGGVEIFLSFLTSSGELEIVRRKNYFKNAYWVKILEKPQNAKLRAK